MSRVEQVLRGASADLDAQRARWAVVGGLAVSARVEPRFTRDADIAVAVPDDAAAEALVHARRPQDHQDLVALIPRHHHRAWLQPRPPSG